MKIKAAKNALLWMAEDRQSLWTFGDICLHNLIPSMIYHKKDIAFYPLTLNKMWIKIIIIL